MNKRPTPETDALVSTWTPVADVLDHARRLERERDEARAFAQEITDKALTATGNLQRELAEAREQAEELRRAGVANAQLHLELLDANATIAHRERELAEAREQAEKMRKAIREAYEALSQLANWRYECDDYDEDMQLPQRDYDEEQVEMMEKTADAALAKLQPFLGQ